jgi:gamma-glutamyltranspeptidase / glutathione hydrolase
MKRIITISILAILVCNWLTAQDRINGATFATRSDVIAQNGMAATSHPLATQIALDILKKGGTAIDAAIAANAALGLMEPTGCGMGGDLFAIIWSAKDQKLYGLNASGRSPKSLSLKYFKDKGMTAIPATGPLPVSVPGCVDGWFELHKKFGKLPMQDILQPTIDYAEKGFPLTQLIAYYMDRSKNSLSKFEGFKEVFMPNGVMPKEGQIRTNPALANTLKKIAKGGRDAYYKGDIARSIDAYMKRNGGFLSYEDLAAHKSEWVEPVSVNYRGYDVWELPPNGQGIAALQMLNMLELYDVKKMGFGSVDYLHTLTEVKKVAFEDRAKYYADMQFYKTPLKQLLSKEYASERNKLINPERSARRYDAGNLKVPETIYLTTADKEGNMISFIQSNYRGMGSGMTPADLGFVLQDRGEMFSLKEGHANVFEPGKRPFNTIIPCFITKDGKPFMSFGVMGGAMQPQGHVQVVLNMIDFGMGVQEAGDAPRLQHLGSSEPTDELMIDGGEVMVESRIPYETVRELMKRGHSVRFDLGGYGGYQAIMWDAVNKVYRGGSESRKDGMAAGY